KVFREWTDLYSKLKLPRTMDFYNRFRTGTCPLGVNTYSLYTTLKAAAPEIDGLWNVALVPGWAGEDGKINHSSTGGGAACCILDLPTTNAEHAWEFLKWWVSRDTQLGFSSEVESILGPTGRITVSNVEAFKSLEWDPEMVDVIVSAMLQAEEIPEYPGSYYVSRSVYQAFWNVVENNQNAKQTLLKFAAEADDEIQRKWKQYENR
ncbi:MAG: ABC transporter substrate-binding protein, partial [Clostridia bacterium]|nr:ABC transporter substrate-binding protein [Clostridia bacterium]